MPSPTSPPTPAQTLRRSIAALLAFWLLLAGVLWWGFSWWEGRQRAALAPYTQTTGELVIPRSRDGHFYVEGEINHQPVTFLVDTGASAVAITVSTANGKREGRLVHGVPSWPRVARRQRGRGYAENRDAAQRDDERLYGLHQKQT